jgi:ectoine hydroxylase-related dioxygenase (phytanoyl-CoA dioxygenase family)
MIEQRHFDHFKAKGWTVIEGVFSRDKASRVAALAEEVGMALIDEGEDSRYMVDHGPDDGVLPRKIDTPFRRHQEFRDFALDQRLQKLVGQLIDDDPVLISDQIFMKPPHYGTMKPYHQDNFYFQCSPPEKIITAWIALDDVDEENGCLRYIDGSHLEPLLPHEPDSDDPYNLVPPAELIDLNRESLVPVQKGGVIFHHGGCLHTSHRNESARWRRAYATHWACVGVTSTNATLENAYFKDDYAVST